MEVRLEQRDLLRRIVLPRQVSPDGFIEPPKRTPGLHVSGLLQYVARALKMRDYIHDADEEAEIERGHLPFRWFMGQAFEEACASLYPRMIWQPGELSDPLLMNCDGLTVEEPYGLIVEEFKWRRAKRFTSADALLKKWVFRNQGISYCLGYGADYVRWHVGSMFDFPDPSYFTYLIKFTIEDQARMRLMIDNNKDAAIAEGFAE